MRMRCNCFSAAVLFGLFSLGSAHAEQITEGQKALTRIAAKLIYGESRCPNLETNSPALGVIATTRNIALEDWQKGGRLRNLLEANIQLVKAEFDSTEDQMFCRALETAYGPKGVIAPGAIRRK